MGATTRFAIRGVATGLMLLSGTASAGWFSHKKAPPPPPAPPPVVLPVAPPPPPPPIPLEFSGVQTDEPLPASLDRLQAASPEVQAVAQWIATSKDNAGLPFVVVDKVNAQVYEFNPLAQLKATAPILLGAGAGDKVVVSPDAPMSAIPPEKRITPAGRYLSKLVTDVHGKTILSIDPANLISLHIVAKGTPQQRRAERLASVETTDNRISFGCINVPPGFFTNIVSPDFMPSKGIVYILPEKTTAAQLFGFTPVAPAMPVAPVVAAPATPAVALPGTTAVAAAPVVAEPPAAVAAAPAAADPAATSLATSPTPVEAPQAEPAGISSTAAKAAPGRD